MNTLAVDINCDLGEGMGVEDQIMPLIDSANIACGAHAGDAKTIAYCIQLALQHQVKIGIHPSYPDRKNFGRKVMDITLPDLKSALRQQIDLFLKIANELNAEIHHLKLHGALYNEAAKNKSIAEMVVELLQEYRQDWILFCPENSIMREMAMANNIKTWREIFLDRNYNDDGSLVSRHDPDAIINTELKFLERYRQVTTKQKLQTKELTWIPMTVDTFCIHGDHPNAVTFLQKLIEQEQDAKKRN